ncbi:hypothetical protein PR202_ga03641 [Eleusine coracana subsp. coracana]|uniref:Rubisco LSMT substrate-binding domain-containing protein n=1 Tax=Eleusine coracana subsp. coracana TaxID=191504 RepID=A0AAV5BPW5_ELECO|nr:hypothetical protein PR202_ga03641 [Eleusine coracana subsp. coracana]
MASISPAAAAAAAVAGAHHRLLLPSSPRRLPRPRPRLRIAACHADTLLPSSQGPRAPPSPAVGPSAAESSATDGFFGWLRSHGLPPGKVAYPGAARALLPARARTCRCATWPPARTYRFAGDVAFEVPMSLVVTLERVLGDESVAELLTTNKLSELACLALYLMYEKKQGKDSFWHPYIKELDRQRGRGQLAVESPLLWTEIELDYLTGSPMRQYPFDIPTEAFPFEIFKQAFVAVQSCVVHLQASLNTEDPQYQEKRMVVQRNGKLAIQNFHVYIGKERETVAELLPYLRLGYISDPDEMQSILSSEGDTCPVSPCTERAVLDQLVGYLKSRLAGYPTTLNEDEAMLADGKLEPKKEVATRLVRLEKKMLHACLQAANEFIIDLPDHTVSPCPAPYAPELK